jgi:hypothetical protein
MEPAKYSAGLPRRLLVPRNSLLMKLAIMQPYLFPYIGYFQLVNAVDTFVIYDDVQYINRGWINRNRILQNGESNLYTFSLQSDSSRKNINERYFTSDFNNLCDDFLKMLQFAYGNAPYFAETKNLVEQVFESMKPKKTDENIASKIGRSIKIIPHYLGLDTDFITSSTIKKDSAKSGQELILEINNQLESNVYINQVNGKNLYDRERFKQAQIELRFIEPKKITYKQFSNQFVPWLSIIDVCMFNSKEQTQELLNAYTLHS